jgi:hypothetical protein
MEIFLLPGVKAFALPQSQGPIFDGSALFHYPSKAVLARKNEKTFLLPVAAGSCR